MASLITCADARKMDEWMEDGVKCVKNEAFRTFVVSLSFLIFEHIHWLFSTVQGYSCNYMDMFGAMAKMGELTEREFYALAILTYCDIGQPHETTCLFSYSHFRHFAPSPRWNYLKCASYPSKSVPRVARLLPERVEAARLFGKTRQFDDACSWRWSNHSSSQEQNKLFPIPGNWRANEWRDANVRGNVRCILRRQAVSRNLFEININVRHKYAICTFKTHNRATCEQVLK